MIQIFKKEILLISLIILTAGSAMAQSNNTANKFPSIQGSNLEGKKYNLPQDLEGKFNLVLVAFKREQQKVIDTWIPLAKKINRVHKDFKFYEIPVLSQNYKWVQGFIDGGMRSGIADKKAREVTITAYIPRDKFFKDLSIANDDNIHLYLLDNQGLILWQAEGPLTEKYKQELDKFVDDNFDHFEFKNPKDLKNQ